jgi:hypothetical protein
MLPQAEVRKPSPVQELILELALLDWSDKALSNVDPLTAISRLIVILKDTTCVNALGDAFQYNPPTETVPACFVCTPSLIHSTLYISPRKWIRYMYRLGYVPVDNRNHRWFDELTLQHAESPWESILEPNSYIIEELRARRAQRGTPVPFKVNTPPDAFEQYSRTAWKSSTSPRPPVSTSLQGPDTSGKWPDSPDAVRAHSRIREELASVMKPPE